MAVDHAELMSRVERKKRELELAVEKTKGEHAGVTTEEAALVKKNLDYVKEVLEKGVENLSDAAIEKLEQWLPRK